MRFIKEMFSLIGYFLKFIVKALLLIAIFVIFIIVREKLGCEEEIGYVSCVKRIIENKHDFSILDDIPKDSIGFLVFNMKAWRRERINILDHSIMEAWQKLIGIDLDDVDKFVLVFTNKKDEFYALFYGDFDKESILQKTAFWSKVTPRSTNSNRNIFDIEKGGGLAFIENDELLLLTKQDNAFNFALAIFEKTVPSLRYDNDLIKHIEITQGHYLIWGAMINKADYTSTLEINHKDLEILAKERFNTIKYWLIGMKADKEIYSWDQYIYFNSLENQNKFLSFARSRRFNILNEKKHKLPEENIEITKTVKHIHISHTINISKHPESVDQPLLTFLTIISLSHQE